MVVNGGDPWYQKALCDLGRGKEDEEDGKERKGRWATAPVFPRHPWPLRLSVRT